MDTPVKHKSLQALWSSSALSAGNAAYIEQLYEQYLEDPVQLPENWRLYFDQLQQVPGPLQDVSHSQIKDQIKQQFRQVETFRSVQPAATDTTARHDAKQVHVLQLINAYRFRGHQWAKTNPLCLSTSPSPLCSTKRADIPELTLQYHQLSREDYKTIFNTGSLFGPDEATLEEIYNTLQSTYCGCIGAEYMHITDTQEKRWIQDFLESRKGLPSYSTDIKKQLLEQITAAEGLEKYLHSKYVGQKRFSLEGGESLIPMLKGIIQRGGGKHGVKEIAVGMAHRGRLNVLVNIMGKTPAELFMEFEGKVDKLTGTGDVKYHMGFSSNFRSNGGLVHVALAFNPSHLEIVSPVVEGSVRARQDRRDDKAGAVVLPVLIHGDAAFAGQGVVMETFNMSQSRGYSTKGTIHIVVNNQIGFTTSNQEDMRSTLYCTDVAKMVNAPIFHVNGDDPEAVLLITQLALDYRMHFSKDVVIDLVCYRRHGHSEADEPMATQPVMYQHIKQLPTTRAIYAEKCIAEGVLDQDESAQLVLDYRQALETGHTVVKEYLPADEAQYAYVADWSDYKGGDCITPIITRLDHEKLTEFHQQLQSLPEGFALHKNVAKILESRDKMAAAELNVDWGFAETMAYASLLSEGYSVRLSGQDSGRGTFFHRHAVLHDQNTGEAYVPLRNLKSSKANFLVINSLLSEEAVLAFEYGYATTEPNTLTIWEAQFGDFANNAQVVIDQFISAGEQKWNRLSGLVMMLPHGFEGQGPEHSSARLERYLQLCAQHNMQVCLPTTAAQIFHLLRRQMLMKCRTPLIIMTPKSLLRHKLASTPLACLIDDVFHTVIPEIDEQDDNCITRVVFCSGRVYYDLLQKRREENLENVAIIRIEQLYPFPEEIMKQQVERYPNADDYIWCQEEPMNQGAWYASQHHIRAVIGKNHYLHYAGRPLLAAPAVGYLSLHKKQLKQLVNEALGIKPEN